LKKCIVIVLFFLNFAGFLNFIYFTNDLYAKTGESQEKYRSRDSESEETDLGKELPLYSILPFVGILLSIALFPLFAPHFWHKHFPKVSLFWALIFALPFLLIFKEIAFKEICHIYLLDYIPFIILLSSLFTVSGGIYVRGAIAGTPAMNLLLLLIGTFLASFTGTTGASMLMIRPVLRANAQRKMKIHTIVFFIFLISNIGGSLTPLGDPPLFLGFLHGVPFFWTLHLLPHMFVATSILLLIYYLIDFYYYKKEKIIFAKETVEPFRIEGAHNLIFLAGIMGAVLLSGFWSAGTYNFLGVELSYQNNVRDVIMILMGILSLKFTDKRIRQENEFTWNPILEVAYLFAGIFMTIIPALAILRAGSEGSLGIIIGAVKSPHHYFWASGGLSSFLDNAPTYLTFLNSCLGKFYSGLTEPEAVNNLIRENAVFLKAISTGSVFMGANSYIGNAPNFMVKSIAEEAGVSMPSFFGYMLKYSIPILIPIFILVTVLFFS
jgi:Na+/H+ antiporter NhaD/arsenite permease-like protein